MSDEMWAWLSVWSDRGANDLHNNGPADAIATSLSFASLKLKIVVPFWCRLTQVVLEKRPLNGCRLCPANRTTSWRRPVIGTTSTRYWPTVSSTGYTYWCSSTWSRARTRRRSEWLGTPRRGSWNVFGEADCCSWRPCERCGPHERDTARTPAALPDYHRKSPVYTIQPVVKPVVQPGLTTGWTNSGCLFNTLDVCLRNTASCQTGCTRLYRVNGV